MEFNEEYIRRLAEGDPEVQRHFTSHFSAVLRVKLRSKLRSPQMIEDVRQETFLRILQTIRKDGGVHHAEKLGSFVNSVCRNVMLEAFRSAGKLRPMPEDVPEIIDEFADPTRDIVTAERKEMVAGVLSDLSARDRELLRQVFFEERDKDRICQEMHINPEYLRVLIHRAKSKFKDVLQKKSRAGR